ncbi:MAG: hypothetical protein WBM62_12685, partial [Crocosphaera sp.]
LQSIITELERVLWEDKLTNNPEVSLLLERIRHYLLMRQCTSENDYDIQAEKLTEVVLNRLDTSILHRLQPLQEELTQLHDQRQSLLQEIQTLEQQRQEMLSDFLQEFSRGCYAVLEEQLTTTEKSSSQEQQSNLIELNSSLEPVFNSLFQELQTYSDSLREGIERMYSLGQQGETRFLAYFNRLQQQLSLSFQESTKNREIIDDPWYLGIDLTNSQFTVVLFTWKGIGNSLEEHNSPSQKADFLKFKNNNFSEYFTGHCLSKILKLDTLKVEQNKSFLDICKQQLTHFNQVLNQSDTQSLKLGNLPLENIVKRITEIVLICPSQWNEKDRNLLKNIISETLIISQSKEIIWIPKPIALTLSHAPQKPSDTSSFYLLFELTETMTELSLIDISQGISGIMSQGFSYGTKGIDEDILCQLIYPQWYEQITTTIVPLAQPFPNPGMADLLTRESLNKQLENYPLGMALLEASQLTRLILQQQETFASTIMHKSWSVHRQALSEKVIKPWIQQIAQKLKILLSQGKKSPNYITKIIVSGEAIASVNYELFPWLTEMFPNATLIQAEDDGKDELIFQGLGYLLTNNS